MSGNAPYQQIMGTVKGMQIKEKVNKLEAVTALVGAELEMANKYKITDETGEKDLFYAVEGTGFCARQFQGDCAPWEIDIMYAGGDEKHKKDYPLVYKMERPCTWTCCCFNRPIVSVTDQNTGNEVGSIKDPWACCNMDFEVMDPSGEVIMNANGGCCQPGVWCPLPCGPCAEISFDLTDAEGHDIGHLTKKVPSCLKFLLAPDADNYELDFEHVPDSNHRVLLMALALFMDFRLFNNNSNDEGGGME